MTIFAAQTNVPQLSIDRSRPEVWTVTISNPPINMLNDETIEELQGLVSMLEQEEAPNVVVFESANPEFFIAHYDASPAAQISSKRDPTGRHPWLDFVLRLSNAPVVSIAKIRGRARGVGNEFALACDLRFASRENAIFGQPELGVGLIPGGGSLEWLPRMVGRSRAMEIVLSADDFDAATAEIYGMINRALDDGKLNAYVDGLATRIGSFDKQALHAAKRLIGRVGVPEADELKVSNQTFFESITWTGAQDRRAKVRNLGYGRRTDFELNFGNALKAL